MSLKSILDSVESGIEFIKQFAPAAAAFGLPVGPALEIASSITRIIENIAERADEAGEVISSQNAARIKEITAALAAQNDELRKLIDAS